MQQGHVRSLGRFVKAAPHLLSINGNGWFLSSRKIDAKLVKKGLKARRLHQPEKT